MAGNTKDTIYEICRHHMINPNAIILCIQGASITGIDQKGRGCCLTLFYCCLLTPFTLASWDSDLAACGPSGRQGLSTCDNVVRMWVKLKICCVSCVWILQRGNSGDGCVLASTLCMYELRKGNVFVLSWARV